MSFAIKKNIFKFNLKTSVQVEPTVNVFNTLYRFLLHLFNKKVGKATSQFTRWNHGGWQYNDWNRSKLLILIFRRSLEQGFIIIIIICYQTHGFDLWVLMFEYTSET